MKGIIIDEQTGDLAVSGGSLVVGDVGAQVALFVLVATPGEFKQAPLIGAGARLMLGGAPDPAWPEETRRMLSACGVEVSRVWVESDQITLM
jgi:hypothetical protein